MTRAADALTRIGALSFATNRAGAPGSATILQAAAGPLPPAIERVWIWGGGTVPQVAIDDAANEWWTEREALGATDFVLALNDYDFRGGLGINARYQGPLDAGLWRPVCRILETFDAKGIAPHLMVFLPPEPAIIAEAATTLAGIVAMSGVTPRSIHLDLEGWWTGRGAAQRRAGEQEIRRRFHEEWEAPRPELGIGVTCVGHAPPPIWGALAVADFAAPQMYASVENYGRPPSRRWAELGYQRAGDALPNGAQIVVGQSANPAVNSPEVLRQMLRLLLDLDHPSAGRVRELAFWSDLHLLNSARMRTFFVRLADIVTSRGLSTATIGDL